MRPRIAQELGLLRRNYSGAEHAEADGEDWFLIPTYPVPPGWRLDDRDVAEAPLTFLIKADYPGAAPYGFLLPDGIRFGGTAPGNTGGPPKPVPFAGSWLHFSWQAEDWSATANIERGANLVTWSHSFFRRLKEGA